MRRRTTLLAVCATLLAVLVPSVAMAAVESDSALMHRLYNPYTGEHLYTADKDERLDLEIVGWRNEGIVWFAPTEGAEVYRLYNPYVKGGDHHYTTSATERDSLTKVGWRYEGVGWRSAASESSVPLYRLYNPNATTGTHHYTTSATERDVLVKAGWRYEGISWKGVPENEAAVDYGVAYVTDSNDRGWGMSPADVRENLSWMGSDIEGNKIGFTQKSIDYAIAHMGADWNEQAAMCAEDTVFFGGKWSRKEFYDLLTSEGFTSEQANYGIEHGVKVSFSTMAARRGDFLLNPNITKNPPKSRSELFNLLVSYGFERSEAEYGADYTADHVPRTW